MPTTTAPHTTQHNIDHDADLVVAYLKRKGQAELHAAGCAHLTRTSAQTSPAVSFSGTLADDWFDVAPCARLKGSAARTCTDCNITFPSAAALANHNAEVACER